MIYCEYVYGTVARRKRETLLVKSCFAEIKLSAMTGASFEIIKVPVTLYITIQKITMTAGNTMNLKNAVRATRKRFRLEHGHDIYQFSNVKRMTRTGKQVPLMCFLSPLISNVQECIIALGTNAFHWPLKFCNIN